MVPAFFEDPLDGASISSNAPLDQGNDIISVSEESSTRTNPETPVANATPSDEKSIEVIPRNPNFFENLGKDANQPPATDPSKPSTDSVAMTTLTQSRRCPTFPFKISKHADIFGLPLPYSSCAKSLSLSLPLTDWHDTFCSEFHFWLNADLNVWSTFIKGFATIRAASNLQKLIDWDLKDHATAFLGTDR
ncbi:hypothetical protein ACA910_001163 [Epithemia clementina (nom. ined.)]